MTNSPCMRYLPNILSFLCCPPLMFPSPLKFKRLMGHTKNMDFFWPTFIWLDPLSANTGCFWLIHLDSGTITNEQGNRVSDTCFQQSGSGRRTWWWESFCSVTSFFEFWEITALWRLFSLGFALTFEEEMYLNQWLRVARHLFTLIFFWSSVMCGGKSLYDSLLYDFTNKLWLSGLGVW